MIKPAFVFKRFKCWVETCD